ncbi:MAG TPA: endonuclease/exonuclease/phosphatase family protein [Petrimonas sp.]|uniref:endonuclease/exonuclease/phosphatase family protein n=1 Tax=Petrimonas sp. TaxID=2023866 RepID=UPI000958EDC1|nr:endonuclease/exonuclease/phosphatase family protein [Petrimonas sp.]OJV35535.1 MAG: endonuclease [Bacteroidia bacterium 43-41]HHV84472.1 endonuclease/exonuclease/phosphatase family protein [Petrimonas sp.]
MKKIVLSFLLFFSLILMGCSQAAKDFTMNIATYNIRMDTEADSLDAWQHRKEMVKGLVRFHDFDIFGTQEAFKHQLADILELENYAYVGVGRDDGKDAGEHSAIVYRKDRFDVLKNGDFWFAENPDVPGKGWDAVCCNRICSWAKFKDKKTGKEFFVFNSHFDHQGQEARKNSSLLLLKKIEEIAGKGVVFCTGDFNATPDDEPIQILMNDGRLKDSFRVSACPPYGTEGTFNSFRLDFPMRDRIDYIWVSEGVKVNKYGVLNDVQYGHFPSDHFPVMVNVTF